MADGNLPVHHGVSVQGHKENLAAASWTNGGKEDLKKEKKKLLLMVYYAYSIWTVYVLCVCIYIIYIYIFINVQYMCNWGCPAQSRPSLEPETSQQHQIVGQVR